LASQASNGTHTNSLPSTGVQGSDEGLPDGSQQNFGNLNDVNMDQPGGQAGTNMNQSAPNASYFTRPLMVGNRPSVASNSGSVSREDLQARIQMTMNASLSRLNRTTSHKSSFAGDDLQRGNSIGSAGGNPTSWEGHWGNGGNGNPIGNEACEGAYEGSNAEGDAGSSANINNPGSNAGANPADRSATTLLPASWGGGNGPGPGGGSEERSWGSIRPSGRRNGGWRSRSRDPNTSKGDNKDGRNLKGDANIANGGKWGDSIVNSNRKGDGKGDINRRNINNFSLKDIAEPWDTNTNGNTNKWNTKRNGKDSTLNFKMPDPKFGN